MAFSNPKYGLHYYPGYLTPVQRRALADYVCSLKPLWEMRYHDAGSAQPNRQLLRPVYWLGAWQFACLGYYHPPQGIRHRSVRSDPYPEFLAQIVRRIEREVRARFQPRDIPRAWRLNTCLVNYYGNRIGEGKAEDLARVGEHRDFEPGPVASLSLGERAIFQFVRAGRRGERSQVVLQQWLEDASLQVFGGERWKEAYFHRVQRVERKKKFAYPIPIEGFEVRRINLTFRYVPDEHICGFAQLPQKSQQQIQHYVAKLADSSPTFRKQLTKPVPAPLGINALHQDSDFQ